MRWGRARGSGGYSGYSHQSGEASGYASYRDNAYDANDKGKGKAKGKDKSTGKGKGKSKGFSGAGGKPNGGGSKPTDDPSFVQLSEGATLTNADTGTTYHIERYVASGTFGRVFRVRREGPDEAIFAAKVMRHHDSYIQYTSDAVKEGQILQQLEQVQAEEGQDVLTMRCFDAFAVTDEASQPYYCLILEWLEVSLFDVVRDGGNRGLHLSMVSVLLKQLLTQLHVLQTLQVTHTDIKHKNCCLASGEYFLAPRADGTLVPVLAEPSVKFIDYGNAVFEGDAKTHPIHTKQFRAPEVLLNVREGWSMPSDVWTLGITAAYLVSGQLLFQSHDPAELVQAMTQVLGPFPAALLDSAQAGQ